VVRGEPGVGKSALLEYVAQRASGCRVAQVAGVQAPDRMAMQSVVSRRDDAPSAGRCR
jgi:predicted ATP-dependent serine protease